MVCSGSTLFILTLQAMFRHVSISLIVFCFCFKAQAQKDKADSLAYYNDLFTELDGFLDSLTTPRSVLMVNLGVNNSFVSGRGGADGSKQRQQGITISPALGYFHKSGFGVNAAAYINTLNEGSFAPYQLALTGSFDHLRGHSFLSGISVTRYFTTDSVSFYTSPLETEVNIYLMYRRSWLKPSLSATYAWGSTVAYEERQEFLPNLRTRRRPGYTVVTTEERISDFSITAAVRHDFSWLDKLGKNSIIRVTPQLALTSGTQRFGFNQNTSTSSFKGNSPNILYSSESVALNETSGFQPLSVTAFFKAGISKGAFSLQPQVSLDYYLPAKENNLTAGFVINAALLLD